MPTPQFNVRVPERYHDLLRLIVERLRANPDGADALADALSAVCRRSAGSGADNLPTAADSVRLDDFAALFERVGRNEKILREVQKRLEDLEGQAPPPAVTRQPRPTSAGQGAGGAKRLTAEQDRQIADMLTAIPDEHSEEAYLCQIAGMTIAEAIELKGWTWKEHELAAAVERWREKHRPHVMLLLEQHRQIADMLKAGKSGAEIMTWLDLQKAAHRD